MGQSFCSMNLKMFTQAGKSHCSKMDRMHGVWSFAQRPNKLEVEDPPDQTADTTGGKQDHLEANRDSEREVCIYRCL